MGRATLLVLLAGAVLSAASCNSNGTPPTHSAAVTVSAISAGYYHMCATLTSGAVRCWGSNADGELGNASHLGGVSFVPLLAVSVSASTPLVSGNGHNCVTVVPGNVECWGRAEYGELGNGAYDRSTLPVLVSGITGVTQVAAGSVHSCAVISDATVQCWGANDFGQLGDPSVATTAPHNRRATPVAVAGVSGATAVAAGSDHTCALLGDTSVLCWGGRFNGGAPYKNPPVTIANLANVVSIAAGNSHNCAIVEGGRVKCWASNSYGQLGNGSAADSPAEAVFVTSITSAAAVEAGWYHTCALLSGGAVACWGRNDRGQLGIDAATAASSAVPVTVSGLTGASAIAAGSEHTCALLSGGEVKCWGDNSQGQLGLDPALVQTSAVPVTIHF